MSDSPLHIRGLSARYPGQDFSAIENIDWSLRPGDLAAIIGPNGAGKSTLLKAAMELTPRQSGEVLFFGQSLKKVRRRVAYIPQRSTVDWDFPVAVLDVAAMGLYSRIGWLRPVRKAHRDMAMAALEKVGMENLAHRQIGALSGGQQQRTFLARALAQDADLYLMDEPLAGVDAATQNKIIQILHDLKSVGKTIIVVHHNLATVERVFEKALLLNRTVLAEGAAKKVLTRKNLAEAYGVPIDYLSVHDG